ncbi:MAG TPA: DUF4266 domain-containing protein [Polyangiales bacterium]|nr:DUF4266 domain-containing protein [Polyangiales bacterium]
MLLTAAALLACGACVDVRPEDKEHLAEPAMTYGGEGLAEEHEQHVLDNREGSTGGGDTRGGGCGCN